MLYYPVPLEAYRSDKVANLMSNVIQGDFLNYQQFYEVSLVGQGATSGSGGGLSWPWIAGLVVLIVIVGGGGTLLVMRRRKTATDRE